MRLERTDHAGEAGGEDAEVRTTRIPRTWPDPKDIDKADEALGWLLWLKPRDRKILMAWSLGVPMYWMRRKFGFSRWTVRRRVAKALGDIAVRLAKENR